ncbi:hypothetical protein OROHE_001249 [Orobanche hederae]
MPLSITDNVVNGFLLIDIVLTFFVAYLDKVTYLLVDDPKLIAWKYATTWLAFDVISTIPSELARKISPKPLRAYGIFNMLRLWRLGRVNALFARLLSLQFIVLLASIIYLLLIITTKKGLGSEQLCTISLTRVYGFVMLLRFIVTHYPHHCCLGLMAYLIWNMTNLVVHGTRKTRQFRDTIHAASSFALRNGLPAGFQEQMLSHLCLRFRTDSEGLQQQAALDSLPKAIRSTVFGN